MAFTKVQNESIFILIVAIIIDQSMFIPKEHEIRRKLFIVVVCLFLRWYSLKGIFHKTREKIQ